MHKKNMIHRDIKPSNVVIKDPSDMSSLKLIDFGLAVKLSKTFNSNYCNEECGTLIYQAPE
jgi:calcium-dependent protein kinase